MMITQNRWLFEAPLVHETASYGSPYTQQEYYNSALGEQEWRVTGEFETGSRPVGPHPEVNTPLPRSGPGFVSSKPTSRQFGLPATIRAIQAIGAIWQQAHPNGPRIGIRDISFQGGGSINDHKSHQKGIDVDIRPVRNDGQEDGTTFLSPTYSRPLTQELVNIIRANGILKVEFILFNDNKIKGMKPWKNHDNHLHVRYIPSSGGPIPPPSHQQPVRHRRHPAPGPRPPSSPSTAPTLITPKWMGSKPPGTTIYVNIPLGSE